MKTSFFYFRSFLPFAGMLLIMGYSSGLAQEITEQDKKNQEEVLKQDPKNYGALFVVGAYYYNLAVDPHVQASNMKLNEYLEKGETLEKKKEDYLKKALPYFENAYTVAEDKDRVKDILKGIYQQLGIIPSARITDTDLNTKLNEKLSSIQFKEIIAQE
ncbi:MAG: hypothetical protein NW226_04415 [Microscillaceae bacterium]|nr:hypothetical protein [Microscillaceae bacterium]